VKEDRIRDPEQAAPEPAGALDLVSASPVSQLQARIGNAGLARLHPIQRQAAAPDWIRNQLGISSADETSFDRLREAHQAASGDVPVPHGGVPLDGHLREHSERQLGVSLGDVRIVPNADQACDAMGAVAFATPGQSHGHDVCLSSSVRLDSEEGQFTLMHELAHVAQQKRGETAGLDGIGGDEARRDSLEQAADACAGKMTRS
jgi:hypothetical protein